MSSSLERITDLVEPIAAELGLSVYDLDYNGGTVRVLLDRDGGIDMGSITDATRKISSALDDADLISSAYTLEVSSPGIERVLRTEAHFEGAIGERVKVKLRRNVELDRRVEGQLESVDGSTIVVRSDDGTEHILNVGDIERARTQFVDTAAPKPGKQAKGSGSAKAASTARSNETKSKAAKSKQQDVSNDQE